MSSSFDARVLRIDPLTRYDCVSCGLCCSGELEVQASSAEKEHIERLGWGDLSADERVQPRFEQVGAELWRIPKVPGEPPRCLFLDAQQRCVIHAHWGPEAKPAMCRRFPFQHVGSDEAVWVSASYGCPGVTGGQGRALAAHADDLGAIFAQPLAEAEAGRAVRYPLTPERQLPDAEIQAAFEAVVELMGDDLFGAMRQLAAFAASAPEGGCAPEALRPTDAAEVEGAVRLAFALTLYRDAVDSSSFLGRLGAVLTLPKLLAFGHRYRSRLLDIEVDMAEVLAHPGALPLDSHALLVQLLKVRLLGRKVFSHVPSGVAGIGRLLLETDLVLFLARALARGRDIEHRDLLQALEAVELHVSAQAARGGVDARLRQAWGDPGVALGAAQLFTPG
jgi:Fe-S-cluster containining protein